MVDYDVVVIGGGPAGLTAGRRLAQAGHKVLVVEKESFGGQLQNLEWVEDYPNPGERIAGPALGSQFAAEAESAGAILQPGEVVEVEQYSSCMAVSLEDGASHTCAVVIVAGGLGYKKLGVPTEARLEGKGVIHCAICDGGLYADKVVAVCGGGDAGLIEGMYLAKFAAKVIVIEVGSELSARPDLQERAMADPKLDIRLGKRAVDILGEDGVSGVVIEDAAGGEPETLDAYGVLVHVGFEPATACVEFLLTLDEDGYAAANEELETEVPGIIVAGDIRAGSPRDVAAAVSDGERAALTAGRLLQAAA